jgi:hypothetical protein
MARPKLHTLLDMSLSDVLSALHTAADRTPGSTPEVAKQFREVKDTPARRQESVSEPEPSAVPFKPRKAVLHSAVKWRARSNRRAPPESNMQERRAHVVWKRPLKPVSTVPLSLLQKSKLCYVS